MLGHPNTSKPYYVHVDTSKHGIGAVLMQEDDAQQMVVEYFSKATAKEERQYGVTELEGWDY